MARTKHEKPTENPTWRSFLRQLRPGQRDQIAKELGVDPSTLSRWLIEGKQQQPRNTYIQKLKNLSPPFFDVDQAQHFKALLEVEFPDTPEAQEVIPATFYRRVLEAFASVTPSLGTWTIINLLRQQLRQLDPNQKGLYVEIFQCLRSEDNRIRALTQLAQENIGNVQNIHDQLLWFAGRETLLGQAIMAQQPRILEPVKIEEGTYQGRELFEKIPEAQCVVAFPILRFGQVAGGVIFYSRSANFIAHNIELLSSYLPLFALAFTEFYPATQIQLEIFPTRHLQTETLQNYRIRVSALLGKLRLPEAELQVLRDIQQELKCSQS